ncbi:MAG: transcription elongation factor GreA [Myxococcales bacterium]|nr:MAG: transcription elongation factor GreA [Myxococcales bacterium]
MTSRIPMTPTGKQKLREELDRLKSVERPRIIGEIERARAHGDLSENAEYQYAKEEQGMIEARLRELEDKLGRAEVIDPSKLSGERVMFGAKVRIFDIETEVEERLTIVGPEEADLSIGYVSFDSAVARALIGRNEGDEVRIKTPKGIRRVEIVEVEYGPL